MIHVIGEYQPELKPISTNKKQHEPSTILPFATALLAAMAAMDEDHLNAVSWVAGIGISSIAQKSSL